LCVRSNCSADYYYRLLLQTITTGMHLKVGGFLCVHSNCAYACVNTHKTPPDTSIGVCVCVCVYDCCTQNSFEMFYFYFYFYFLPHRTPSKCAYTWVNTHRTRSYQYTQNSQVHTELVKRRSQKTLQTEFGRSKKTFQKRSKKKIHTQQKQKNAPKKWSKRSLALQKKRSKKQIHTERSIKKRSKNAPKKKYTQNSFLRHPCPPTIQHTLQKIKNA